MMHNKRLIWIQELSKTLREAGVVEYEQTTETQQGKKYNIKLKLGNLPHEQADEIELVKLPIEPEDAIQKRNKKEMYFDLLGYPLSDQELEELPDTIIKKTG